MSLSPYKPQTPSEGHGRRAMKDLHSPQSQIHEGDYAIKVSMRCLNAHAWFIYLCRCAHGPAHVYRQMPHTRVTVRAWALGVIIGLVFQFQAWRQLAPMFCWLVYEDDLAPPVLYLVWGIFIPRPWDRLFIPQLPQVSVAFISVLWGFSLWLFPMNNRVGKQMALCI